MAAALAVLAPILISDACVATLCHVRLSCLIIVTGWYFHALFIMLFVNKLP